ncbi:helix-turn-helix domain-containing protein [Flavobacterium celericrescens]|uniref:Helix-turn-helix transcriptional regulator n=1 Tax=Flavobacterium celericrescens TaxID=2709780 RepID=A0ABX0ICC6_9FLAO|nr:helix-turn-helix transcriptional regulator [Flavobacterium celericrescens]NHM04860.1 helix-turn-helix transcriptional regulator [Flavobacterium celericrescens]
MKIDIGKLIKEAREKQNLTQEELAQKVGKKRSYISRIEGVEGSNIKLKTLIEIVDKGFKGKITIDL